MSNETFKRERRQAKRERKQIVRVRCESCGDRWTAYRGHIPSVCVICGARGSVKQQEAA